MRAGRLRQRVTIETAQEGRSASGGTTATWTKVATVWARVETLQGDERFAAQTVKAELSVRVTIRYRPDVVPKQRIVDGPRIYLIEAVLPSERRDRLQLLCREEA